MMDTGTLLLIAGLIVLLAIGGYFAWKHWHADAVPVPERVAPVLPAEPSVFGLVAPGAAITVPAIDSAVQSFVAAERAKITARAAALDAIESAMKNLS